MASTAGSRASANSWALLLALGLAAGGRTVGCGAGPGAEPTPDPSGFDRQALLASLADEVFAPAFESFTDDADALADALDAWAADPAEANRGAARLAFTDAMFAWQELEPMQVGPAGSSLEGLGGMDLRDQIYSWPTTNPCRVDQELVAGDYGTDGYFDGQLVIVRGLDALEYLLFYVGEDNACAPQLAINEEGQWAALGAEEVGDRRRAMAAALGDDLAASARALADAWSGADGFAAAGLGDPGGLDSPYFDAAEALDAVYDALFFVEKVTKDRKVGTPSALIDGVDAVDPDLVELPFAGGAAEAVAANLRGFRRVFDGGSVGFDDFLVARDAADLADEVFVAIDEAIAAADAVSGPLDVLLEAEQTEELWAKLQAVGNLMKGDLALALELNIPSDAAGDND